MRVELFPFQKRALADIRMKTAEAMGSYHRTHAPQVVSFTAPTGAGKTIIMASLIENIFFGDEKYVEQPGSIIVWLSDSTQLCVIKVTDFTLSLTRHTGACKATRQARLLPSCKNLSRAAVWTVSRLCR